MPSLRRCRKVSRSTSAKSHGHPPLTAGALPLTVGYGGLDVGDAVEISGFVAPGFEPVRAQFERNFTHHREVGASVCVYRGDECVVDLWGGVMDPETEAPWQADSIINTFSVTKGLVALAVLSSRTRAAWISMHP